METSIRAWRKHRQRTIEDLAAAVGMSTGNLSKLERGIIPYGQSILEALARELKCSPADLLRPFAEHEASRDEQQAARYARLLDDQQRASWFQIGNLLAQSGREHLPPEDVPPSLPDGRDGEQGKRRRRVARAR